MRTPLPPDWNPKLRLRASRAARLPPDILQPCDEEGIVEVSVRDFLLACDPSPEDLARIDRERKALGLNPLFGDDL